MFGMSNLYTGDGVVLEYNFAYKPKSVFREVIFMLCMMLQVASLASHIGLVLCTVAASVTFCGYKLVVLSVKSLVFAGAISNTPGD